MQLEQAALRRRNRARISSPAAKQAFDCLVDAAGRLDRCDGYFNQKKPAFVFRDKSTGKRPHSIIVNQGSLRFYFREPTRSSRMRQETKLRTVFGQRLEVPTNSHLDEWAVNVESESEARFLVEEVLKPALS